MTHAVRAPLCLRVTDVRVHDGSRSLGFERGFSSAWGVLDATAMASFGCAPFLRSSLLASIACAVALSATSAASAQDAPLATSSSKEPKRHELGATALGGLGVTDYDYYDGSIETVYAWGVAAEYAYRLGRRLRVGVDGGRTALSDGRPYGDVWTATPFVGLQWGSGLVQGGVRAGFGFAYGGRRAVPGVPDRHGAGWSTEIAGELALVGHEADAFARIGFQYARTSWSAPLAHLYPTDLPVGFAFVTLGARWKI